MNQILLIGYSQGADVLPFMINRLPEDLRSAVSQVALLAPGTEAFFEFHVSQWLKDPRGGMAIAPELHLLEDHRVACIYGEEEEDSLCSTLPTDHFDIRRLAGGHHFDRDYELVTRSILEAFDLVK